MKYNLLCRLGTFICHLKKVVSFKYVVDVHITQPLEVFSFKDIDDMKMG